MAVNPLFITGIDTGIGKTLVAAILAEALEADYWKPVQAGALDNSDTQRVRALLSNDTSHCHPESYRLKHFMSPHAGAEKEGITIDKSELNVPDTDRPLLIEGAGGIMVPLTREYLILDLMADWQYPAILVSKNYLGSINHTLLSVEILRERDIPLAGIIFNGPPTPSTESVILEYTGVPCLGKIPQLEEVSQKNILQQAQQFTSLPDQISKHSSA
jgi:dethiobiotin synthetase